MSKSYDKYLVQNNQNLSRKSYDKYRVSTPANREVLPGNSWPALLGKSALKGIGSIADIPNLAAQGLEGLARGQSEAERR